MNEKRFEDDGVEYTNNYNYALLDTYYEFDSERIIEWNKHSDNAVYTDLERITEILNIKQMRLESLMKHREEVGKLFDRIDEQQSTIQSLKEEKDSLVAVIDENLLKGGHELSIKHKEAKDKMKKGGSSEVSAILDVIFYWRGYIKALEELKERVSDE